MRAERHHPEPFPRRRIIATDGRDIGPGVVYVTPDGRVRVSSQPEVAPAQRARDGWECVSYEKSRGVGGVGGTVTVFGRTDRGDDIVLYFPAALFEAMRKANRRVFYVDRQGGVQFLDADGVVVSGQVSDTPPPSEGRPSKHTRPPPVKPRKLRRAKREKRREQQRSKPKRPTQRAEGDGTTTHKKTTRNATPKPQPAPATQKEPTQMELAFLAAREQKSKPT